MLSNNLVANDIFFTRRKVAWEDLTLECSASLSQTGAGVTTAEATADEDEDADGGAEYVDNGTSKELSYIFDCDSLSKMSKALSQHTRGEPIPIPKESQFRFLGHF